MIPWRSLLINSLWILGLTVLLADLSFHYWLAQAEGTGLRRQFQRPGFQKAAWLGLGLLTLGLAGTSDRAWETALWVLLALFCLVSLVGLVRNNH